MKESVKTKLWCLSAIFLLINGELSAKSAATENLRLIVSAGSLNNENPYEAFYRSLIFSGENSPLVVSQVRQLFETSDAVFYSEDSLDPNDIIHATKNVSFSEIKGFLGASFLGFPLESSLSPKAQSYLGSAFQSVKSEKRKINNKVITAFSKQNEKIIWPKSLDELKEVPAAVITDDQSSFTAVVTARLVGHLANKLLNIDNLLAKAPKISHWIELGSDQSVSVNDLDVLLKRKPSAFFLGTAEMAALATGRIKDASLMIYPFKEHAHLRVLPGIDLWSVSNNEEIWPLFRELGAVASLKNSLQAMKESAKGAPENHLNIVRVFSESAASAAAKSVDVDLVLLQSSDPMAQLPQKEIIELKNKQIDSYEQVAPVVRVSYLAVDEIRLFGPKLGNIERIEIVRHQVEDNGLKVADVKVSERHSELSGLFAGEWSREDFRKLLGGIMLNASKANVAIFDRLPEISPIKGAVPFSLMDNLINPHGFMTVISIPAVHVKTICKLIGKEELALDVYGIDPRTGKIGMRVVDDNEFIDVALSDKALLELYSIVAKGGFTDAKQIRAPFVEGVYADLKQLFFAGGPKMAITSETKAAIDKALALSISSKNQFDEVFAAFFAKNNHELVNDFMANPYGVPHHVLTLDIAYLDVGLSKNVVNQTYLNRQSFTPVSRGKVNPFAHFYVFSKFGLTWDALSVITTLGGDVKFMQSDPTGKPERDKSRFGLRFRLPWERSYFQKSSVVISPIWHTEYETQFLPSFWSSYVDKNPRTKLLESLLGFNFNFLKLGMNMDLGCLMATDFNKSFARDAIDVGPALNFTGKWSIIGPLELSTSIKSYYMFAMPQNTILNKRAFGVEGTAWLRFARVYDFSFSLMSDFFALNLQNAPNDFSLSSIFGLTVSYGRIFRLFG